MEMPVPISVVQAVIALILGGLAWQINRLVGRVDALERSHSDYRETLAKDHYSKSEVRDAVEGAIRPLQRQLDRIESLSGGHPERHKGSST